MLRLLILASVYAIVKASLIPDSLLEYPRSLRRLFRTNNKSAVEAKKTEREVCETEECKLIAQVIKDSIDESVDPCDDFYDYACGNWTKSNPPPGNRSEWSLWSMVSERIDRQIEEIITSEVKHDDTFSVKLAKKWYRSCLDTDAIEKRGVEPLLSTLWRHGGWPLIMENEEWNDDIYNWQIVDDQFARLLGFNAFYDLRYDSLTFGGNSTIIISTPHLPVGIYKLLSNEEMPILDSSDENNESGEGSQEKGSRERGQQKQNEEDDDEEGDEEDESDDDDWNTAEEDKEEETEEKRKITSLRKQRRKLDHVKKKKTMHKRMDRERRARRNVISKKSAHRSLVKLEIANKHKTYDKVRRNAKGELSGHGDSSHRKLITKRHNAKDETSEERLRAKLSHNKRDEEEKKKKKKKRMEKDHEKIEELRKKKITSRRKIAKQSEHSRRKHNKNKLSGKHNHGKKMTKKLHRTGMKAKVHASENHKRQKITDRRIHHAANNKMSVSKHGQTFNSTEDTDDSTNASDDDDDDDNNDEDSADSNNENGEDNDDEENNNDDDANDEENDESNDEDDEDDEEEKQEKLRESYREYILNVSLILSRERGVQVPKERIVQDIKDMVEFVIKLAELDVDDEEPMNTTLQELQAYYEALGPVTRTNRINWARKVQKIFSEAGVELDNDAEITIMFPKYIDKLRTLLAETPGRTLVNYVHWSFINKIVIAGPSELRDLGERWNEKWPFDSREEACLMAVQLTKIAGYEYVKRFFSENIARTGRDMIDDIQKEVEHQIKSSTWMDEDTRHFVLDKLVHMKNWIGYPDWYQNATLAKRFFQGLTIGTSFYENILSYIRYTRWKNLRRILHDENISVMEEMMDPLELNAFFMPTENSIAITAVDFQSPFFAHDRPWYVNFGIIGYIMGHEVNHGFDDFGHLYDKDGNQMEWLAAMAQAYDKRAKCFVDQYNGYSIIKGENYTIENYGNQTSGENIADTMGLQTVFRAYKRRERQCKKEDPVLPGLERFSNDQLFFLSSANLWCETVTDKNITMSSAKYDVHSTARLRVIGSMSNSADFAKAFKCPAGSPMNPENKCNIWE